MAADSASASEEVQRAALSWPGVTVHPHRFGGVEFRLGKRELGHLHGNALADIPFPRVRRDELIASGEARPHHVLPDSGWVSVPIRSATDVSKVIDLLHQVYEHARARRGVPPAE